MKKTNFIVIILTALVILLVFSPAFRMKGRQFAVDALAPIAKVFDSMGKIIKAPINLFSDITSLRREKNELTMKLTSLEVDKSQLGELQVENALLKKELGFLPETGISEVIPAKIIQREPTSFLDYVIIDKGKNNGVRMDAAVLSSGVFIGQIKEVYDNTAKIILITSKDSLVQAMLQNSRSKGILRGGISGLFLENIMQDTEFAKNEYIVTSGLGGKIKSGILIGRAGDVQGSDSGIYKRISVEPILDLSKLELIFVEK